MFYGDGCRHASEIRYHSGPVHLRVDISRYRKNKDLERTGARARAHPASVLARSTDMFGPWRIATNESVDNDRILPIFRVCFLLEPMKHDRGSASRSWCLVKLDPIVKPRGK
uniref:Uncharacterized protein n=1 Tax=Candidatus Kentrum sp. LFY TaxID=2126342 RepID=A0A450X4J9_9GAMM|nr:MAG: hypothetical protein BECKLFY1418C_GA0070996_11724 [Candidatus Kentron sp. LFY]